GRGASAGTAPVGCGAAAGRPSVPRRCGLQTRWVAARQPADPVVGCDALAGGLCGPRRGGRQTRWAATRRPADPVGTAPLLLLQQLFSSLFSLFSLSLSLSLSDGCRIVGLDREGGPSAL
ncbi:MAG: hypothetical protein ACKO9F_03175, partial [Caldilinea sp.]